MNIKQAHIVIEILNPSLPITLENAEAELRLLKNQPKESDIWKHVLEFGISRRNLLQNLIYELS